jgi:hypothetical protein
MLANRTAPSLYNLPETSYIDWVKKMAPKRRAKLGEMPTPSRDCEAVFVPISQVASRFG